MYGYSNQTEPTIQAVSHQYAPDLPRTRRHVESSQPLPALCQPTRPYGTHLHLPGRLAPSGRLASHRLVSCCRPLPGYVTRYRRPPTVPRASRPPRPVRRALPRTRPAVTGQALPGRQASLFRTKPWRPARARRPRASEADESSQPWPTRADWPFACQPKPRRAASTSGLSATRISPERLHLSAPNDPGQTDWTKGAKLYQP